MPSDFRDCFRTREGERAFFAYDTLNIIHAVGADGDAVDEAVRLCLGLHARFDRFSPESELSRLNASAGRPFVCSGDLLLVLQVACALSDESDGAFDPAIGSLTRLWHFADPDGFRPPSDEDLDAVRSAGGSDGVAIAPGFDRAAELLADVQEPSEGKALSQPAGEVRLSPGVQIDLGGIAKGYAMDRAAAFLAARGVDSGFLDFGGSILILGPEPSGRPWRFGLQDPGAAWGKRHWACVEMQRGAFALSAAYERCAETGGLRYHHIVDPRTGCPADTGVEQAGVCAGSAMLADALSTAVYVLGPGRGAALARSLGALSLFRMGDGRVLASRGFPLSTVS